MEPLLTHKDVEYFDIPTLSGYCISNSGSVYSYHSKRIVGNYYCISIGTKKYKVDDLLMDTFGNKYRSDYIPQEYRKKSTVKFSDDLKTSKDVLYQNVLNMWEECSGTTNDWNNYFSSKNNTVDDLIHKINSHIECNNCVVLLDYNSLKISWEDDGFIITENFLSFVLLNFFVDRFIIESDYQSVKFRLYEGYEYETFGMIVHNIFKTNLDVIYKKIDEDNSEDELRTTVKFSKTNHMFADHSVGKRIKKEFIDENSDGGFENYKIDYSIFRSYQTSNDCQSFVLNNLLYYKPTKELYGCSRIKNNIFNEGFRKLLDKNNGMFTISELFCEYCEYYFKIENGIKRLDVDLIKKIIKEIHGKS
jgi:hypothetical protein